VNSKGKEVPHGVRLYSIASSRYGDEYDGKTTTLCVRRAVYNDPETGKEDPAKKGICSNFLCDAKPGDEIMMTGESGLLVAGCWGVEPLAGQGRGEHGEGVDDVLGWEAVWAPTAECSSQQQQAPWPAIRECPPWRH
jgi:hypothetical protein